MFVESAGNALIAWFISTITSSLNDFVAYFNMTNAQLFENELITGIIDFFQLLAWGLFIVGAMLASSEFALTYREGGGNFKAIGMNFIKSFFAVLLFAFVPIELFKFSCDMQQYVGRVITNGVIGEAASALGENISNFFVYFSQMSNPLINLILIIIFLYCVFKVFFGNLKRGGILMVTICVGTLHMIGMPRGYQDGFMSWCKQIISICFTVFMQNTLFLIGLMLFASNNEGWILSIGVLLVAGQLPRFVQMFGMDCSAKGNIGSMVYTASTTVRMAKMVFAK